METTDMSMPPKVAAAVAGVMSEVPKLAKGEKNSHGNYNFASIDDFLEAVRPLCAKHGLIIMQDEESFEMREGRDKYDKPKMWLLMRFSFTLAHSSGETWAHRPTRSIMVDASMGSQAFGAAQSYALKQFERSLFQIATGENGADADFHPPADLPADAKRQTARTASPKQDAEPWKATAEEIKKAIDGTKDATELEGVMKAAAGHLKTIKDKSETAYAFLIDRANKRNGVFAQAPADEAA